MAKKDELLNDPEISALSDIDGVDPAKLMEQITGEPGDPQDPPKPEDSKPEDSKPEDSKPEDSKPKPEDPPAPQPHSEFLKEIFGDRYQTVEEAKQANITGTLDEVETLRSENTELETKLESKPKTNFANDEVALYNEFVKNTGTRDYGVFQKINSADVATMDPMEALVTKHVLEHPELAGKETRVRQYFEKKYNVNPDQVDEDDLEVNKIGMEADGASAKKSLQEIKDGLKVPEPVPDDSKPKELSSEEKSKLQSGWSGIGETLSQNFSKISVPIKNGKEPLLDYEISESEQKEIQDFVGNYAVENQMELNENNVRMVATMVRNQLMINKIPDIVHSVFEKARSLTEEQVHSLYENPSPARNNDDPPVPPEPPVSDEEKVQDEIFNAEMDRYDE